MKLGEIFLPNWIGFGLFGVGIRTHKYTHFGVLQKFRIQAQICILNLIFDIWTQILGIEPKFLTTHDLRANSLMFSFAILFVLKLSTSFMKSSISLIIPYMTLNSLVVSHNENLICGHFSFSIFADNDEISMKLLINLLLALMTADLIWRHE